MSKPVVCVVGAGTAGLEGLLAVHERLGDDVDLSVIAPDREFRYRPMSGSSLFRPSTERTVQVGELAAEVGATHVCERVAAVHEAERYLVTRDGEVVSFDHLLVAAGARRERSLLQGYVWERGHDPGFLDQILERVRIGGVGRVAVIVPRGACWSLPAYELALVLGWTSGPHTKVSLITAESRLLGALGQNATTLITRELDDAGVEAVTGTEVIDAPHRETTRSGARTDLMLVPESLASGNDALTGKPTAAHRGELQSFDFVIALPTVRGPAIPGLTIDAAGFIEVDTGLKVRFSERAWAAGSCIAAALEHSALSSLQADVAAAAIAQAVDPSKVRDALPVPPQVTGILLSGQRDRWLAENPPGTREPSTRCLWWPPGRAVGHMLATRIAAWDPSVQVALPDQANGVPICVPVVLGHSAQSVRDGGAEVDDETRKARARDLENRQLMAIERREREAADEFLEMRSGLKTLATHQRHVEESLRQHGYLRDREPVTYASTVSTAAPVNRP